MNKVLVTGQGLLGTAIKKLAPDFIYPSKLTWDLTQPKKVWLMLEAFQPEVIIHTAAKVGGIKLNSECQADMFYENMIMTSNVIQMAAQFGVKKVIGFGSTCAIEGMVKINPDTFEAGEFLPLTEGYTQHGQPYKTNYGYGYAKRMVEIHLRAAYEQYGMKYAYYVPTTMYGPQDNFNLNDAHVIPSLIHKCYNAMKSGEPLRVWGDGTPRRELLFSEDLAKIILTLLEEDTESMIVGSGEEVPISDMVTAIAECMGFEGDILYETDRPKGQLARPMASQTKLRKFIGKFEFTPFKDGIARTVEWFKNNYPNVRM